MPQSQGTRFTAEPLTFIVRHQLLDGNVEDHVDQGVSIDVAANVDGKETVAAALQLLRPREKLRLRPGKSRAVDPWPGRRRHGRALPDGPDHRRQPDRLDHPAPWAANSRRCWSAPATRPSPRQTDLAAVRAVLPDVEACARETFIAKRNTVKHNRGTDMFEAGNIRFGLEMRRQRNGDGGLALHVLGDVGGSKGKAYVEETELLAFDCFWNNAHYHYGPRNKNHRINWDMTIIDDPLDWTFEQIENRKLGADDRARRLPGDRGRPGPGQDRLGAAGAEEARLRDVRGRRATDRPQGPAAGVHAEPGCRIAYREEGGGL